MSLCGRNNGFSMPTAKLRPTRFLRTSIIGKVLFPFACQDNSSDCLYRRIAIIALFSGLRRFPQGRGFKQWTGDDSKALMKVYLPAIEGHVPTKMVRAVRDIIEFSYLVCRDVHDTQSIEAINATLKSFHNNRDIFKTSGVVQHFNYPRQHSLKHYVAMIRAFGSPNGLCSSITENKHIKAVKKPWRRSNRYKAMKQMLLTNQRLDKLSASRARFTFNGMLEGTCLSDALVERSKCLIQLFISILPDKII